MTNRDVLRTISGKAHKGFTLVELMVTVAIVAILASVGAPQLRAFLVKQQVRSDVDRLTTAIHMARSEALKRSGPVSICPLADASSSTPSCKAKGDVVLGSWSQGWMVFVDYPNSSGALGAYESDTDTILLVEQGTRAGAVATADKTASMTFQAVGIGTGLSGSFTVGTKGNGNHCVKLDISITGRTAAGTCP
ncbi:MAG: GspH/FimT family pseudopilin [Aquabacterium sp.]|uniref:GspH/FimT family pseudopilin n=1 Tax=Aquabacterium sp. TaxID=1872578 RepID=UPI0025C2FCD1|nr:GspH/FimT family pseudopilin [Aquabacterium sp.]MBI5925441.1 GspH/FimT family pseudopilin [Aquabacterium sp.]